MLLNKYALQESRPKHEDKPAACLEKINNKLNNSVYQILEIKKGFWKLANNYRLHQNIKSVYSKNNLANNVYE